MQVKDLKRILEEAKGDLDAEVVFVAYNDRYATEKRGNDERRVYRVTNVGFEQGVCRLNNVTDF